MTKDEKRFNGRDVVDSLKDTGSSLRSVIGEFAGHAAVNYRDNGATETAKNAARQTARDVRGISSLDDVKETGSKLWKRGKFLGKEFRSELRDAVGKTRNSEAAAEAKEKLDNLNARAKQTLRREKKDTSTGRSAAKTKDGRPRIIEGEVIEVDGRNPHEN